MKDRIKWVDNLKGFAILCVILGHCGLPVEMHAIIYSFHMPLFFFLSGLFLFNKKRTFKEEFITKFRSLIIPYFFFNLILIIAFALLRHSPAESPALFIRKEILTPFAGMLLGDRTEGYLWFLLCLFLSELVLYPFSRKNTNWLVLSLVLAITGSLVNHIISRPLWMNLDNVLIASSFIALGKSYKTQIHAHLNKTHILALLVFYLIFLRLSIHSTKGIGIDMYDNNYGNYFYFYICAISFIISITYLFNKFCSKGKLLNFLGRNSLLIYCTHTMFISLLYKPLTKISFLNTDTISGEIILSLLLVSGVCILSSVTALLVKRYLPWMTGRKRPPVQDAPQKNQ